MVWEKMPSWGVGRVHGFYDKKGNVKFINAATAIDIKLDHLAIQIAAPIGFDAAK